MQNYLGPSRQFFPTNVCVDNGENLERTLHEDDTDIADSEEGKDAGDKDTALVEINQDLIPSTEANL